MTFESSTAGAGVSKIVPRGNEKGADGWDNYMREADREELWDFFDYYWGITLITYICACSAYILLARIRLSFVSLSFLVFHYFSSQLHSCSAMSAFWQIPT